jgi:Recombination endonuclease VII
VKVRQRKYFADNKATIAVKAKIYNAENQVEIRAMQARYKEKHRQRIAELKREKETGFTPAMFAQAIEHQGGKCPICLCTLADLPYHTQHADHCHTTGQPRGVLCQTCNTALGKFKDDPNRLRRAIAYIDAPTTLLMLI